MRKEVVVASFKVLFQEFSGGIQKIVKPFPVRIVVFQTEV
jgi:hypothetical protein